MVPKVKTGSYHDGQVVAYRRREEILFRYGRIVAFLGSIYDYHGLQRAGFSIRDGNRIFAVPENAMRRLTEREAGR